jgi:hypothetical protein
MKVKDHLEISDIEILRNMHILEFKPGDIIIISIKDRITEDAYANIKKRIRELIPGDIPFVVFHSGIEIGVIRGAS